MKIANIPIGKDFPPFIIAEMSGNHNQSLERALRIVDSAAEAGASAIKLQTYTADTITLDVDAREFRIDDPASIWQGKRLYELYQQAYTPWEWHKPIMDRASELNLVCFSSPFDESAVDFLEELEVPAYKIASFENTDLPLIRKVAATGKPIIISTGMASLADLDDAIRTIVDSGNQNIALLKCSSSYPATAETSNISTIPNMRESFGYEVGISDHTLGIGVSIASIALGATIIEKHFTLSRAEGGVDSDFSLEPDEMRALVRETKQAWMALGKVCYGPTKAEIPSLGFKRSLYVIKDVQKGDLLTKENLKSIRPGYGLPAKYLNILLGKRVNCDISKGEAMKWDFVG